MFLWIESASDDAMSTGSRAAFAFVGSSIPSPSATRRARSSSTLRRFATMRRGTSSKPTFDNSKTNDEAMCALLVLVLRAVEQPRLAVVVCEALRARALLVARLIRAGGEVGRRKAVRRLPGSTVLAMLGKAVGLIVRAALGH